MKNVLDFSVGIGDNLITSLMELAIRPQVSSEPGFFLRTDN